MYAITENARIERTSLGWEDHGILTCSLQLKLPNGGQSFGGWALDDAPLKPGTGRVPTAFGLAYITRLMEAVGVSCWEKLCGTHVRIARAELNGRIVAIGHIIEDRWFDPCKLHTNMTEARR
jgi:hypothetical protein